MMGARLEYFQSRKIVSSIAEMACRIHFSEIGFFVEPLGQEHSYPALLTLRSRGADAGAYAGNVDRLTDEIKLMPDFVISRIQPGPSGAVRQSCLVEAKFRSRPPDDGYRRELLAKYKSYIVNKQHMLFYVVARDGGNGDPAVFLHFTLGSGWIKADSGWIKADSGWIKADDEALMNYDIYFGLRSIEDRSHAEWEKGQRAKNRSENNFSDVYGKFVLPALKSIFTAPDAEDLEPAAPPPP